MDDLKPEIETFNDAVQDRAIATLDRIGEYVEQTADFASREAPLLVQEVVNFQFWTSAVMAGLLAAILLSGLVAMGWFAVVSKDEEAPPACFIIAVIWVLVVGLVVAVPARKAIEAAVAPRKVAVDYLQSLTR